MIRPSFLPALLSVTLLPSHSFASSDSGFYLGIDLATSVSGEIKAENTDTDYENTNDIDTRTTAVLIGYKTESNNRFQISRAKVKVNYSGGADDELSGTDFDWHIVYLDGVVQPYGGIGFGVYTLEDSAEAFDNDSDLRGVSFQLMGGAKFDLHEHVELDLSYRVKSIGWEKISMDNGYYTETVQLSHSYSSLNFGAAFKF